VVPPRRVPQTVLVAHHSRTLALLTLITWLFTASVGAYMFHTLASRGGLRRQRAVRDGLPPTALFGHFGLALTALLIWVCYLATSWAALAWAAVGLLMPAIGLGICTVTLWTPYPHQAPPKDSPARKLTDEPLTDEILARALTDEVLAGRLVDEVLARVPADPSQAAQKPARQIAVLIPVVHGMAAVATFALAVVTAAATR
jgi:hypothetical protein